MHALAKTDVYRVTLFKRKIREAAWAPWLRFRHYGDGLLRFQCRDFANKEKVIPEVLHRLKQDGVAYEVKPFPLKNPFTGELDPTPWQIAIPIDQEALPERKRRARPEVRGG